MQSDMAILKTKRSLTMGEVDIIEECFKHGMSPRQTSDAMNISIRAIQTRYEILRGRKKRAHNTPADRPQGRHPRPLCVISECESAAMEGRRTCQRHATPIPVMVPFGSAIAALTPAQMMRRRA